MTSRSELYTLLAATPVVPVLTVEAVEIALPLARALVAGGLGVLEITLRTPAALQAIETIAGEIEGAAVGAGTVLAPAQYEGGARRRTLRGQSGRHPGAARGRGGLRGAVLPGAATSSEIMTLLERGHSCLKFFPAEPAGGIALPQGARRAPF